jgi:pimeloyl-ACP methyl ester carboxylesterase
VPFAAVNGTSLYYELSGSGDPLVVVHGSWVDHHTWNAVVPAFAESFTVLAYDRRGHGQSELAEGQGSIREDAADLAALIEAFDLAPAHVAASSWGGTIALRLAAERPEVFRTLVAHEPPIFGLLEEGPEVAAMGATMESVVGTLAAGDLEAGAHRFVDEIAFGPGAWDGLPQEVRAIFVENAPTFLDECRDPEQLVIDLSTLAAFSRPALLTQGSESPAPFGRVLDLVIEALPATRRATIAGAGHVPHITHPDAYVETVTRFLH